ncbi:IclR family transcriptional regulator [Parasphingorhabdus pacifica]
MATNEPASSGAKQPQAGNVRSIGRAFALLETMAQNGGVMGLSQLAAESGLPMPTIHRVVRTLVELGYLRQESNRQYVLAPRLIRLGESASGTLSIWARPHLESLVDALGESVNLAMLDGDQIVYVAQAESRQSMRMFTEVGRRVLPHCTAVGKAIMAGMPEHRVTEILQRTGMRPYTESTISHPDDFLKALSKSADRGHALDEGEQEVGVRCVAVAVPETPTRLAMSVSGPATRMTQEVVERAIPLLTRACADLADDLN